MGEGSQALWPMIKPDVYSAGAKRVELHLSGSWCNEIRSVEIHIVIKAIRYLIFHLQPGQKDRLFRQPSAWSESVIGLDGQVYTSLLL